MKNLTTKIIIGISLLSLPVTMLALVVTEDDLILKYNQFKQKKIAFEELKTEGAAEAQKIIQAKDTLNSGCEVISYALTYYQQNLEKLSGVDSTLREQHQADIDLAEDWVLEQQLAIEQAQEKEQLLAISQELASKWPDLKNQSAASRAGLLVSKIKIVLVNLEDASRLINDTHTILIKKGKNSDQAIQAIEELNDELTLAQEKYQQAQAVSEELKNSSQAYQDFSQKIVVIQEARTQTESAKNKIKPAVKALEELVLISE